VPETPAAGRILLIGASRGLGHAIAAAFVKKGWHVTRRRRGARIDLRGA
jgi:NAD(P)-dependent dehydrogenase (short-subunit alcohol dehydrogenase family)